MSRDIAVVCESAADFRTATELADRVLCESIDWLNDEDLSHQRRWHESHGEASFVWKGISRLALEAGIQAMGHFDDEPGKPDAATARRAILFIRSLLPDIAAIVLIRDRDRQPERRIGLEQARDEEHSRQNGAVLPIVIGFAIVERESWVLSGFEPRDELEKSQCNRETRQLAFNPCLQSHKLTDHKDDDGLRSPKRVLKSLCGGNFERERSCWWKTPLQVLRARGRDNGLNDFLLEVRTYLGPIFGHISQDN